MLLITAASDLQAGSSRAQRPWPYKPGQLSLEPPAERPFSRLSNLCAGFMTTHELKLFESLHSDFNKYWMPLTWFSNLASRAREEGRVRDDIALRLLMDVSGFVCTTREWEMWKSPFQSSMCHLLPQYVCTFCITNYISKCVTCLYKCRSWIIIEPSAASCSTMIG